jgi:hypothetical protein
MARNGWAARPAWMTSWPDRCRSAPCARWRWPAGSCSARPRRRRHIAAPSRWWPASSPRIVPEARGLKAAAMAGRGSALCARCRGAGGMNGRPAGRLPRRSNGWPRHQWPGRLAQPGLCLGWQRRAPGGPADRPAAGPAAGDRRAEGRRGRQCRAARAGHAAHDMLLWGSRGMGKSALLRAACSPRRAAIRVRSRWCRSRRKP